MIASKDTLEPKASDYVMPNSQRVYVEGEIHPEVRVPFREISLAPTKDFNGQLEPNEPVRVYDTQRPVGRSGICRRLEQRHPGLARGMDPRARGRCRVRRPRDQTGRQRLPHAGPRRIRQPGRAQKPPRPFPRRETQTAPRLRGSSRHATLVCAPGHHHARDGIHCDPRKSRIARQKEEGRRKNGESELLNSSFLLHTSERNSLHHAHPGETFGAIDPARNHPRIRPLRSRPRPRHHPGQHQPSRARADDHRPQFPRQNQRQHRQQRRRLLASRKKSRKCVGPPNGAPTPSWTSAPAKTSTPPANGSSATRPCPSAPSPSTRRSRK